MAGSGKKEYVGRARISFVLLIFHVKKRSVCIFKVKKLRHDNDDCARKIDREMQLWKPEQFNFQKDIRIVLKGSLVLYLFCCI